MSKTPKLILVGDEAAPVCVDGVCALPETPADPTDDVAAQE